jgi:hypothetical protein
MLSEVEVCGFLSTKTDTNANNVVQAMFNEYENYFPGFPQVCPVLPGKYHEINRTMMFYGHVDFPNNPLKKRYYFSRGRFKGEFNIFTKDRSSNFQFGMIIEVKNQRVEDDLM